MQTFLIATTITVSIIAGLFVICASALRCKKCREWCDDEVDCKLRRHWRKP